MNQYLESINLSITATMRDIEKLCDEAKQNHFASVCVAPYYVTLASALLKNTSIEVATVVGYPYGLQTTAVKSYEAIEVVQNGATEVGMVINLSAVKNGDFDFVQEEIEEIRDSIDGKVMKVMVDVSQLTEEELIKIVRICNETFIHYIEIMNAKNQQVMDAISIIAKHKGEVLEIKINSTIITESELFQMVEMGVTRIGTANAVCIMKGESV